MDVLDNIPTSMPVHPSLPRIDPEFWEQLRDAVASHWENLPHNLLELLDTLQSMHVLHGILLALAGLLYLLIGWRIFKVLVILNAAIFGAMLGGMLTMELGQEGYWWIGVLLGACVLGLMAWPLMKLFVALFGGAIGAGIGFTLFQQIVLGMGRGELMLYAWAGAVAGAIVLGLLALMVFQAGVMIATALQGSAMLICGLLSLLFKFDSLRERLSDYLREHRPVLLLIIVGVGLAGLAVQVASAGRHKKQKNQEKNEAAEK